MVILHHSYSPNSFHIKAPLLSLIRLRMKYSLYELNVGNCDTLVSGKGIEQVFPKLVNVI